MEPIYLYPDLQDGYYVVTFGRSDELLCTPNGTVIRSKNEKLIENLVFDLQKFSEVNSQENNSLTGSPLETVSLYSLVCTEIDFWSDPSKSIELEEMEQMLWADSLAHISPGPERVDQLHQWRSIIKILEDNDIQFHDIQYFVDDDISQMKKLAKLVKDDFDNFTSAERAAFIQLNHLLKAPICIWALISKGLSQNGFITALTQTGDFIGSVEAITQEKLEETCPENLNEDEIEEYYDEHYKSFEKTARLEVYEEIEKVLSAVEKFLKISTAGADEYEKLSYLLLEESISHEFKASLRTPYPDYPKPVISKDGKETFIMNKETFLSKKQIHTFLQNIILKTIASLLNTQGGQLVIGVHEFGNEKVVVGIDREGFDSHDEYERHLIQIIKNAFGSLVVTDFVSTSIARVNDKHICVVNCKRYDGAQGVWFQDKLFVRTGPRVDELKGKEQAEFILQRQKVIVNKK